MTVCRRRSGFARQRRVAWLIVTLGLSACWASTQEGAGKQDASASAWTPDRFDCAPSVGQVTGMATDGRFVSICNEQRAPVQCVRMDLSTGAAVTSTVPSRVETTTFRAQSIDAGKALECSGGQRLEPPSPSARFVTDTEPAIALGDYLLAKVSDCGQWCATGWLYHRGTGTLHGRLESLLGKPLNVYAASAVDVGQGDWLLGAGGAVAMVHPATRKMRWGWEMGDQQDGSELGQFPGIAPALNLAPGGGQATATFLARGDIAAIVAYFPVDAGRVTTVHEIDTCERRRPRQAPRFERMITKAQAR